MWYFRLNCYYIYKYLLILICETNFNKTYAIMYKVIILFALLTVYASCDTPQGASQGNIPPDNTPTPASNTTSESKVLYTMPEESEPHEGTWLQWPHEYQYGKTYSNRLDATWVAMTKALVSSEKVHLIVYEETEKERVKELLNTEGVSLSQVEFNIYPTDDVWARDNGPIYARDKSGKLVIQDWGFNGWGSKAQYKNCNAIPSKI